MYALNQQVAPQHRAWSSQSNPGKGPFILSPLIHQEHHPGVQIVSGVKKTSRRIRATPKDDALFALTSVNPPSNPAERLNMSSHFVPHRSPDSFARHQSGSNNYLAQTLSQKRWLKMNGFAVVASIHLFKHAQIAVSRRYYKDKFTC